MVYLADCGITLEYSESKKYLRIYKERGVVQFLKLLKKFQNSNYSHSSQQFKWGDEIELHVIHYDTNTQKYRLQINAHEIPKKHNSPDLPFIIQPESGAWMIEMIPAKPFEQNTRLQYIIDNHRARRQTVSKMISKDLKLLLTTTYPQLGVGDYYVEFNYENCDALIDQRSRFHTHFKEDLLSARHIPPMELLQPHPRYWTLDHNTNQRRGERVKSLIPIYIDKYTNLQKTEEEPNEGYITLESRVYGSGNCAIHTTYATKDLSEARFLYDQFAIISPIMMALSAGCPVVKGKLAATDSRWQIFNDTCDDRTPNERDEDSPEYIPKSRCGTISYYLSDSLYFREEFNDVQLRLNKEIMNYAEQECKSLNMEIDDKMLKHLGFLYLRDPLVIFSDKIDIEDINSTTHYENIQNTNWNQVRLKAPTSLDSDLSWRVEFRSMELQATDEENAAFIFFCSMLKRLITYKPLGINFYIPISKVDENFQRAQQKDAILEQKFWFRKNFLLSVSGDVPKYEEYTMEEIFLGNSHFPGLIKAFQIYFFLIKDDKSLDYLNVSELQEDFNKVFAFITDKVRGKLPTLARFIRQFVVCHPSYKKDSIASEKICQALIEKLLKINSKQEFYIPTLSHHFSD